MRPFLIPSLGILIAAIVSYGQTTAAIHVTVMDGRGESVAGAVAEAMPLDRPIQGLLRSCKSDENGTCTINIGEFGNYAVTASKVEDAYPEQHFAFFAAQTPRPPEVRISPQHPFQSVTAHLGKQAGILIGTVADAITGKPMDANVTFRLPSHPRIFLSGSGLTNAKFRVLVPSDTPVTMVVSKDGYDDWTYSLGRGDLRNAVLLKPGEELTLEIRLRPKS